MFVYFSLFTLSHFRTAIFSCVVPNLFLFCTYQVLLKVNLTHIHLFQEKRTINQRKVDVGMLNAVKSDVSSVSPSSARRELWVRREFI